MTGETAAPRRLDSRAEHLLQRMRADRLHVLVHPYAIRSHRQAFCYLFTDSGRREILTRVFAPLVPAGFVRVKHVFSNGELLYEAVAQ